MLFLLALQSSLHAEGSALGVAARVGSAGEGNLTSEPREGHGGSALSLAHVLFLVMASADLPERALWASKTWCSYRASRCLFVAERPICARGVCLPMLEIQRSQPPRGCCEQNRFFCSAHTSATLHAQYRFLPALLAAKQSDHMRSGAIRWTIIVDDDSWVFPPNLLGLLGRLQHRKPLYLGDFGHSPELRISFACGGGGSVLSQALLEQMDVARCIRELQGRCMQSDWMVAHCVRSARGTFASQHGCRSCTGPGQAHDATVAARLREGCHFMQTAGHFMRAIRPEARGYPAIVHFYHNTSRSALWQYHTRTDAEGRWIRSPGHLVGLAAEAAGRWVRREGGSGSSSAADRGDESRGGRGEAPSAAARSGADEGGARANGSWVGSTLAGVQAYLHAMLTSMSGSP